MHMRAYLAGVWLVSGMFWSSAVLGGLESGLTRALTQVDAAGVARVSVPLALTPGPGGLTPSLALQWASDRRGGAFGHGWDITGLPSITRCVRTVGQDGAAAPITMAGGDAGDRFCLGNARLRRVAGVYGAAGTVYQTESETFVRIISQGSAGTGPAWFTLDQPDGSTLTFGGTTDSRIEDGGGQTVRVWALSAWRDRAGNTLRVVYQEDGGPAVVTGGVYGSQYGYRPLEVRYATGGNGEPAHHTVRFQWEAAPMPEAAHWLAGTLVVANWRLKQVDHWHDGALVRRWSVVEEATPAAAVVTECGPTRCREPVRVYYRNAADGVVVLANTGDYAAYPQADATLLLDINGDGRDDFVSPTAVPGKWTLRYADPAQPSGFGPRVLTNVATTNADRALPIDWDGDGRRDLLVPLPVNTTSTSLNWWWVRSSVNGLEMPVDTGYPAEGAGTGAVALDVNADGREDLVYAAPLPSRVMVRLHDGVRPAATPQVWWSATPGQVFCAGNSLVARRQDLSPVDFDADGRGDLVVCTLPQLTSVYVGPGTALGSGIGGYAVVPVNTTTATTGVLRALVGRGTPNTPVGEWVADLPEADVTTPPRVGDFNGDGYQDLWYRLANGTAWTRVWNGKTFAAAQPAPALSAAAVLLDHDGDGTTDLLEAATDAWRITYARRGREAPLMANDPTALLLPGSVDMGSAYRVGDVDGDGTPDLFGTSRRSVGWQIVKRATAVQALVQEVTDGGGTGVRWSYGTGTACEVSTVAAVWPQRAAHFSQPVCRMETSDGRGGWAATTYRYGEVRRDLLRRESLGAAWREVADGRRGQILREEFQQGFPLTGWPVLRRATQADGTRLLEESWTHAVTQSGTAPELRRWPQVTRYQRRDPVLGGPRAGSGQRLETHIVQRDSYGSVTQQTVEISDLDALSPGFGEVHRATVSRRFQHDPLSWCLGQVLREDVQHLAPDGTSLAQAVEQVVDSVTCRPTKRLEYGGSTALARTYDFLYDACGNLATLTLTPTGLPVRARRQDFGARCVLPLSTVDALGFVTRQSWRDELGLPATITDPNGEAVLQEWDEFGEPVRRKAADGSEWRQRRQPCLAKSCAMLGGRWWQWEGWYGADGTLLDQATSHFDERSRIVTLEDWAPLGASARQIFSYDAAGYLESSTAPAFIGTSGARFGLPRDAWGRAVAYERARSSTDPTPVRDAVEYDGAITSFTDAAGGRTVYRHDVLGRLRSVTDALGATLVYAYSAPGLVSVTDALGAITRYSYDAAGRRVAIEDPAAGRREILWDSLDQVVAETDAKGQSRRYEYDLLGRRVARTEPEGVTRWTFGSNPALHEIGRPVAVEAPGYLERLSYDVAGRLVQHSYATDRTDVYDYSYDAAGRVAVLAYPVAPGGSRLRVRYGWDGTQLVSLRDADAAATLFWQARAFDARGAVIDELLGNGVERSAAYDSVTGLPQWQSARTATGALVQDLTYTFDERGLPLRRVDRVTGADESYQHDLLGRLRSTALNGVQQLTATYDGGGNILSRSDVGTFRYDAVRPHRLLQAGSHVYGYDANGNVTLRDGQAIEWASFDQPLRLRGEGQTALYTYGPDRAPTSQLAGFAGGTESTRYVGALVERVTTTTREHQRHLLVGAEGPVAWIVRRSDGTTDTWYATQDANGHLDTLTGADGVVVSRLRYAPFGARRSVVGAGGPSAAEQLAIGATTRRGFAGQSHADNVGLLHFGSRVLDPVAGRFLSPDPLISAPFSSQDWNRYAYAWNSPLAVSDPSGAFEIEFFFNSSGFGARFGGSLLGAGSNADGANMSGIYFDVSQLEMRYFSGWTGPAFVPGAGLSLRFGGQTVPAEMGARLDALQGSLDAASVAASFTGAGEPLGMALDSVNGVVSLARGEFGEAAEHAVAMVPVAGTLKNVQFVRRALDKLEARRAVTRARSHQQTNPRYGHADAWETRVLPAGTTLLQFGRPNQPGAYFFTLAPEAARAAGTVALYDGLQMRTSDNHGRWTQVQVYRVTRPIGGALSVATRNGQHGNGGLEQYFLTRTDGLTYVGTVDLDR